MSQARALSHHWAGGGRREVNVVQSAYGKGGKNPAVQWFIEQAKENARYVNGQKLESWTDASGVQFSSRPSNAHGNTVHTEADLVKLRESNPTMYQFAGERSAMSEPVRANLAEAQRLAEAGTDNEAIRQKTLAQGHGRQVAV